METFLLVTIITLLGLTPYLLGVLSSKEDQR